MQHDHIQRLWPDPTGCVCVCVCKDRIYVCMMLYAPFPLVWYATWLLSEKMSWTFDLTLRAEGVCKDKICAFMVLYAPFSLIWYATWLLSKKIFDLFTPSPGSRVWLQHNICYHVAACIIPFNLICNMPIFWKSSILAPVPPPKSNQGADPGLQTKITFDMFHFYCTSACMQNFGENIDN